MVWFLLVYTIGFFLVTRTMEHSFDMQDDPWKAIMWPLMLIALFIQWLEER